MENKKNNYLVILLIIIVIVLGGFIVYDKFIVKEGNSNNVSSNTTDTTKVEDVPKNDNTLDQSKTASDNAQINNSNEYIEGTTLTEEDIKKMFIVAYFHQYNDNKYGLENYRINKMSFDYNTSEFKKQMGFDEDTILVLVDYDVKPSSQESYNNWMAGNGKIGDDGWFYNKSACLSIKKDINGYYYIAGSGTGW